MSKRLVSKLIHVGDYVAEVEVEFIYTDDDWSPYLSINDAAKLDDVRQALQENDIERASLLANIYRLLPVAE